MVKKDISAEEVEYGDGIEEFLSIVVKDRKRKKMMFTVKCIPPKTKT